MAKNLDFQMYKGKAANLPTLLEAEPAFTTDTKKMYVGSADGNVGVSMDGHTHNYAGSSSAGGAATTALACTGNSATATKATKDSAGQQINTTYIKGLSVSGKTITYTRGDNTTGTITTQDTNTTYSAMTGATSSAAGTAGLVPAPAAGKQASFLRGDGTWVVPTNTTYSAATTEADGLMSASDKTKLDGIATGANKYTHPSYTARTGKPTANATPAFGGTFTVSQITSDASGHVTGATDRTVTIPNTAATTSAPGLMSAADKTKLDGIASGANQTTVDSALSSTSTNPVQNKVINTALAGKAASSHTHNYAGSSSAGGVANNAYSMTPVTTGGTGAAYTATVSGITALTAGVSFIMVPNTVSTSTAPTLNVNGLGAKTIKRRLSNLSTSAQSGYSASWLASGKPYTMTYDGSYWIVEDMTKPAAADLYGTLALIKGGTGATDAATARTNLGLTTETWTFTLEDGSTVTKAVYVG